MAPRAYWKGYLKLSLVSCPIALFAATSERETISFHQLNKKTGHRIKYRKVDDDRVPDRFVAFHNFLDDFSKLVSGRVLKKQF